MVRTIGHLLREHRAAVAIEYGLITAVIAMTALTALQGLAARV